MPPTTPSPTPARRLVDGCGNGSSLSERRVDRRVGGKTNWLPRWMGISSEEVKTAVTAITVTLLLKSPLAEPRSIPSLSMYPTLDVGDRILAEKVFSILIPLGKINRTYVLMIANILIDSSF